MNDYQENRSAEQIRAEMDFVRNELGSDVEQVVDDAGSLGDISAYVKAQPLGWMIAAAAAGYFLVPSNKNRNAQSPGPLSSTSESPSQAKVAQKSSLVGAAFGLATTMATRLIVRKITESGLGLLSGRQNDNLNQTPAATSSAYATGKGNI